MLTRPRKARKRHCAHVHLQSLHGAVINSTGGFRLQCVDCWTFLDGPPSLALVDRDPEEATPTPHGWTLGTTVGEVDFGEN